MSLEDIFPDLERFEKGYIENPDVFVGPPLAQKTMYEYLPEFPEPVANRCSHCQRAIPTGEDTCEACRIQGYRVRTGLHNLITTKPYAHFEDYCLPAKGMKYRPTCGALKKVFTCPDHPHDSVKLVRYSCYKLDCPECYEAAASRSAARVSDILTSRFRALRNAGITKTAGLKHIVVSPDRRLVGNVEAGALLLLRAGLERFVKIMLAYAHHMGVEGGAYTVHLWRYDKVSESWVLSPHLHMLAVGYTGTGNKEDGIIVHTVCSKGKSPVRDRDACVRTFAYILTHAAIRKKDGRIQCPYKYFGIFKTHLFKKIDSRVVYEACVCEKCERPLCEVPLGKIDKIWEVNSFNKEERHFENKIHIRFKEGTLEGGLVHYRDRGIYVGRKIYVYELRLELCKAERLRVLRYRSTSKKQVILWSNI